MKDLLFDEEKKRYVIQVKDNQYFITERDFLEQGWFNECPGLCFNDLVPSKIIIDILFKLYKEKKELFRTLKYIIKYNYQGDNKISVFDNWYDAAKTFNKMKSNGIYTDMTANFSINEDILKAVQYNEELEKNIKK